jgi:dipeptidase E
MIQKIIAIGGGDIRKNETLLIDQEIVLISGKKNPKLLFIPTASLDDAGYIQIIHDHFTKLGCTVETLCLVTQKPDLEEIKTKIVNADIIYVGGGNTLRMMNLWRKLGVDKLLQYAYTQGKVLCGVSAGSICWFNAGNSDSRKFKNPQADYIKVTGLGFIEALHCPHFDSESARQQSLKKMLKNYAGVAIALEDCAALQIVDDTYRILTSKPAAKAYKIYWQFGVFYEQIIPLTNNFQGVDNLLKKDKQL